MRSPMVPHWQYVNSTRPFAMSSQSKQAVQPRHAPSLSASGMLSNSPIGTWDAQKYTQGKCYTFLSSINAFRTSKTAGVLDG